MYEIIIATHGPMAQGMKESLRMFTNKVDHVYTLCLDESGIASFEKRANALIEQVKHKDTLILCDIGFATPFHVFAQRIDKFSQQVEIIAGINLPGLLEAVILQESANLEDIVHNFKNTIQAISLKEHVNAEQHSEDE